ncbi:phosphotransferase [Nocardia neocaledoniensis]|uniref:phosphotransferase n=1 Tax=Nocardia neocaledoniensis TaxID=236511 RepID=UPI0024587BE8|nr:phosphotransferase [Nocardia neocaledoniensis]
MTQSATQGTEAREPVAVAMSTADMTTDWFQSVLKAAPGTPGIAEVALAPIGGGLLARMVRATLTYADKTTAPTSVVVKFPTDDPGSSGLAQAMGLYELETSFYRDIAPQLTEMSLPKCYHSYFDPGSNLFNLVLEDLSGRTRPGDVLQASSLDECASVLRQLVNFQAPLWNSPALHELEWIANPARTFGIFDGLSAGLVPFLDRFGHGLEPEHVQLFESVLPRAGEWVRSWKSPTVVQHGDFRTDNIMFGTDSDAGTATVIDFQTVRLGPPGVDPAYFLGSSLSTETRRSAERDLITDYHQQLLGAGVTGFAFDECWASYREGALYGVFLFVGAASQVESTERGDRLIVDQIRRYADMAIDLDSVAVAGLK